LGQPSRLPVFPPVGADRPLVKRKCTGKFWPKVRALIWEKAQELYQTEQALTMGSDFKGLTATRQELREGGYFYRAKLIVLANLYRQRKGLLTIEEEEMLARYGPNS
jgi:hypothetical protein